MSLFNFDGTGNRALSPQFAVMGLILLVALTVPGRALFAADSSRSRPAADPFAGLYQAEIKLAKSEEEAGNIRSAAYHYDMVANLAPAAQKSDFAKKAAALRQEAKVRGEQAYKEGLADYDKGQAGTAFKAFLRTLRYDPSNHVALRKIKDELIGTSVIDYVAVKGDTFQTIAQKNKFDDPSLAWIIPFYNDMSLTSSVSAGEKLKVPVMIGVLPKAAAEVAKRSGADQEDTEYEDSSNSITQAQELLKSSKFEEASKLAAKVLDEDPVNKEAKAVANASNYGIGKRLQTEKKYEAALLAFGRVDPSYLDTRQQMTAVRGQVVNSAEDHYASGVKYYVNDNLDDAIKEFEITLELNPNHPQAAKDLQQAKETREKLRNLK